ncbi:MAG: glycosyltransferase [Chloroflexota bacterium]
MKIAVVAPTEIPARRANTLQVMKMTQEFCALGHLVRLAAPTAQPAASRGKHSWQSLAHHYGLQHTFEIDWLAAHPRLRRYDFSLRAVRWARSWQAELLYTRLPQVAALASTLNMPTIFEIHDLPQGTVAPWLFHRFLRGPGARRLVVITRSLANDLAARFAAPAKPPFTLIAPDGVDLDRYAHIPSPLAARQRLSRGEQISSAIPIPPDRFTAGYTGHLYPGRGSGLLLQLSAQLPTITFLIVGGEPQEVARLKAQAQAQNLENVHFTGFVPNAELPLYQAACDVLLMPYQQHVAASSGGDIARYLSPMKMFEYLACQRAILSSDLPVLQEVLNSNNAILLSMHDPQAWIQALQRLQSDPALTERLATQARQTAQRYTWAARAALILSGGAAPPHGAGHKEIETQ